MGTFRASRDVRSDRANPPGGFFFDKMGLIKGLAAALILFQMAGLSKWLGLPLIDEHSFRQTQTALSAYWIYHEGYTFDYITPVLGFPWAIPFEFPLYQLLVAWLAKGLPFLGLDASARIVSWVFSLLVLGPLWKITLRYGREPLLGYAAVCLYLASPFQITWGRSCMIESTALFLSLMTLWRFIRLGDRPTLANAALAVFWGAPAALVKATTPPVFLLLGCAHVIAVGWRREGRRSWRPLVTAFLPAGLIAAAVFGWTHQADAVKAANPLGALLTSEALTAWNFGGLAQKLSLPQWYAFLKRSIKAIVTPTGLIFITLWLIWMRGRLIPRYRLMGLAGIGAFLATVGLFTNLHFVHSYYQYSCAVFLTFAIACFLVGVRDDIHLRRRSLALLGLCLLMAVTAALAETKRIRKLDYSAYEAGLAAESLTRRDSAIIVLGADWSSAIQYYARRKGLTLPAWGYDRMPADSLPLDTMGGLPIDAVVLYQYNRMSEADKRFADEIKSRWPGLNSARVGETEILHR